MRSFVIGLSSRASSTSTSAVISSPGRTGALKLQSVCRKTEPGPGRSSATTAFSSPVVTPPWTMIPPNRDRVGRRLVVVQRVAVAGELGEELDVASGHLARPARDLSDACGMASGLQPRPGPARCNALPE